MTVYDLGSGVDQHRAHWLNQMYCTCTREKPGERFMRTTHWLDENDVESDNEPINDSVWSPGYDLENSVDQHRAHWLNQMYCTCTGKKPGFYQRFMWTCC